MGARTALQQSKTVMFAVLLVGLWTVLVAINVYGSIDWGASGFAGRSVVGGIAGLLVLAVTLGLLVTLYSELSETEPAPEAWPPR